MTESTYYNRKRGSSKKVIIFTITALLIIGGSVAAFVLLNLSDKQKYFLAEQNSFEIVGEQLENRFEPELDWQKKVQANPTDTIVELSATYNDPATTLTAFGPAQIINNSTLRIHNEMDVKEKKMATEISGAFGGITIDGLNVYLTSEKLLVKLPFLKELLQVKEGDVDGLLKEVDPALFTGKEKVDFDTFFTGTNAISKDDQEYIQETYLEMIYQKLPDSAFKSSDETVEVDSKSIDAEKITFHLTEKELKDMLSSTMGKMKNDKRLKDIIRQQLALQTFGAGVSSTNIAPTVEKDIDKMINQFESSLDTAIKELETFQIPDGLTSTIWVHDDLIVKRDFSLSMGEAKDALVTFEVNGTQMLEEANQMFNYKFALTGNNQTSSMTATGDLSWTGNKANDSIKLATGNNAFTYEGTATLKDGERDFERVFTVKAGADQGGLNWSGNADYNEDHMSSENTLTVQVPGMKKDMFSLQMDKEAKLIKQVEIPEDPQVKDIGSMTVSEIEQYYQDDVLPQLQQWIFGIMGTGGNLNGL